MKIKICFNNETHRLCRVPDTFQELSDLITSIFLSSLPPNWTLEYIDSEGDKIMMGDDTDYKEFINAEVKTNLSGSALKVYIVERKPFEVSRKSRALLNTDVTQDESNKAKDDSIQVQEISPKLEIQREELKVEVPKESKVELRKDIIQAQEDKLVNQAVKKRRGRPKKLLEEKEESASEPEDEEEKPCEKVCEEVPIKKRGRGRPRKVVAEKPEADDKGDLEELVNKAVEKNIAKIAAMAQSYLLTQDIEAKKQAEEKLEVEKEKLVHEKTVCDGCGVCPIVGVRYICSVLNNFNFCENCEKTKEHPYSFIKVKFPGQVFSHAPKQVGVSEVTERIEPKQIIMIPCLAPAEKVKEPQQDSKPEPQNHSDRVMPTPKPKVNPAYLTKYSVSDRNTASYLKQLLPEASLEKLLEFVANAPKDLDVIDLMENFKC